MVQSDNETGDRLPAAARISRKGRIHLMDEIRGLCVLLMIFYHAFYTMSMLFHWELGTKLLVFFSPAEPFFAGLFILISGISSQLSHSNLIRGLKLLGVALALTLVTYFIIPSELIVFGILHMLSVCMIVFGLGQKLWDRIPLILGLAVCAVLFLITMPVSDGYLFPSVPLDLSLFLRHLHRPLGQERQVPGLYLSSAVYIPELDGPPRPDFISYSPAADLRRVHFDFLDHFPLAGLAPRLAARLQLYRYLLLRRTQLWILPPYSAINFTYSPGR